jgi:hypothetical protein
MNFVGSMLRTSTLLNGLVGKDPGSLTLSELDTLQQYVNKGRSLVLLKEHPQLESIFALHALKKRESVVDILLCFLEEGGVIGSQDFTKMVEGMIYRELLSPSVVDLLTRNRFLVPGPIPNTNTDGVLV